MVNFNYINFTFIDSFDNAKMYCMTYHPNVLYVRGGIDDFNGLDDADIEWIQEILDESDDDEDVEVLFDDENEFPIPKKSQTN